MKQQFSLLLLMLTVISCAGWVDSAHETIRKEQGAVVIKKQVPLDQYNDLLVKYKNLEDELESEKMRNSAVTQKSRAPAPVSQKSMEDSIDVFVEEKLLNNRDDNKEQLTAAYQKAKILKRNKKFSKALELLQVLEQSPNKQILVRAKYHIGQIYYLQGNYDLALQVYEAIISQYSFSSLVLPALEGAAAAAAQLKQTEKQMRYSSVLKDFFGMGS